MERKFLSDLLTDVNSKMLAGVDKDPNLSRDIKKPALFCALGNGEVDKCIIVGGSHSKNLSIAVSNLGLDTFTVTQSGWKISNDSIEAVTPALKEKIEAAPKGTPIVLFCLDNSTYFSYAPDGSMKPPAKSSPTDDKYHIEGELSVAPDRWISITIEKLNRLVSVCKENTVFVMSPLPRYVVSACCKDKSHITNYEDSDYLSNMKQELDRLNSTVKKRLESATLIDTMELLCAGKSSLDKLEHAITTGWQQDPVHPTKHTYAKIALHLLEKLAEPSRQPTTATAGRGIKRKREEAGDPRGGKMTYRSRDWMERLAPQQPPWAQQAGGWRGQHGQRARGGHEDARGGHYWRGGGYGRRGRFRGRGYGRGHDGYDG